MCSTDLLHHLVIQIKMPSSSCALLMLRAITIFNMTSSLKQNEESLAVEKEFSELGMVLLLIKRVHFEAKKLLK